MTISKQSSLTMCYSSSRANFSRFYGQLRDHYNDRNLPEFDKLDKAERLFWLTSDTFRLWTIEEELRLIKLN